MGQSNNKPNIDAYLSALLVAAAVVVVGLVVIIFVFLGWEFFFDYAVDFFSFSSMALIDRLNVILVLVAIGVFVWLVLFGRKKNVGIRVPCLIAVVGAIVPSALWLYYSYYMTTPFGGIYVFAPLLFAFIYLIPMGAAIGVLLGTVVEYFRKSNDGIHHTAPYFALDLWVMV